MTRSATSSLVIDTDAGSDDAVALVLALTNPRVHVHAITVVSGNVPVEMATQNALYTRELCRSTAPVHVGADRPLLRQQVFAHEVHGSDGMGDIGLPLTGRDPDEGHAVDVLIDLARSHPGEITLVTLGPLTNVALALRKAPDIAGLFHRVVMMAGTGDGSGNVTPAAEFNVYVDPEAAEVVFRSGMALEMVGWDVSRNDTTLTSHDVAQLAAAGPMGRFCMTIQRQLIEFSLKATQLEDFDLPDPLTVAVAIDRALVTRHERRHVDIETTGTHTAGMTVVDQLGVTGKAPNVDVVRGVDRERFMQMLRTAAALGTSGAV